MYGRRSHMQSTAMHTEVHTWPSSQTGIQRPLPHRASLRSSRMYSSQASGSWVQADFRRQQRRANMPHGVSAKKNAWSASKILIFPAFRGCLENETAPVFELTMVDISQLL